MSLKHIYWYQTWEFDHNSLIFEWNIYDYVLCMSLTSLISCKPLIFMSLTYLASPWHPHMHVLDGFCKSMSLTYFARRWHPSMHVLDISPCMSLTKLYFITLWIFFPKDMLVEDMDLRSKKTCGFLQRYEKNACRYCMMCVFSPLTDGLEYDLI